MSDNMHPLVTCIILTYQHFEFIITTLRSVLDQDYPNIELIIGDDGSDAFPGDIIKSFIDMNKNSNIKKLIIKHNEFNEGTVKNLKGCIIQSTGEYFITISAGDELYNKNSISAIANRFLTSGALMISFGRLLCTKDDLSPIHLIPDEYELKLIEKLNTAEKQYKTFSVGNFCNMVSGSSTFFSRAYLSEYEYDDDYVLLEDAPRFLRFVRCGGHIECAYDIVSTRYRDGGISTAKNRNTKTAQLLKVDAYKFMEKEVIPYLDRFSIMERRIVKCTEMVWKSKAYKEKINCKILLYPDYLMFKLVRKLKKKRRQILKHE